MENNIIVDAEEKFKREQRLKRFGANDPEYLKQIQTDKSMKLTPDDINPINPKETYKLNIKEEEGKEIKFDKKRLMLFGVNLMNTEDIENYFNYKLKKIYWLNDFTCLVEFDNEESSLGTYWHFTNSNYDDSKSELENYNWKKSKNYMKMNRELDIEIRVAEEGDVNKKSDRKESVYYKFYNNNRRNYRKYKRNYRRGNYYYNNYRNNNYYYKRRKERSRDKDNENKEEKEANNLNDNNDIKEEENIGNEDK
jgi:hypothetical protein